MTGPIVVDAGPLYAYVDADDRHHLTCLELLETLPGPLIVPALAIAEATYLMQRRLVPQAEVRFLGDLAQGAFEVVAPELEDWLRVAALVARYRDLPLGTTDATVVVAAERFGATTVLTTDRRHFSTVRPRHVAAFELLP